MAHKVFYDLERIRAKKGFICDMDGVIYHGNMLLPGVKEFVEWLANENKRFLFLTNSSERSPRELSQKLSRLGLTVSEDHFYTSAMATAAFLKSQKPENGSAYVIGEPGLINALYDAGFSMNDINPDYVVVGETSSYNWEKIEKATLLVNNGAKLIGANPDVSAPSERGIIPATGSMVAPIAQASGKRAYFVGKPNPLMMRHAIRLLQVDVEDAMIVGDRMDTDIIAGIESEIDTTLVLSGVSTLETIKEFPYRPTYVMNGVCDFINKD